MNLFIYVYDYDTASSTDDFMGKWEIILIWKLNIVFVNKNCQLKLTIRAQIDLRSFACEKTHFVLLPLEDGAGTISLLITITGKYSYNSENDFDETDENALFPSINSYKNDIIKKYVSYFSFWNVSIW